MKTKEKVLNYIKKSHKNLLEDLEISIKHIKLLNYEVSYKNDNYSVFTYTQKVAPGIFLRHFIWMTEDQKNFFLVNTQQKFKLNDQDRRQLTGNESSMYESIGGGLSLTDENVSSHGWILL